MVPFQLVLLFYTCIVVFAETRSKGNFLMLVGVCYLLKELCIRPRKEVPSNNLIVGPLSVLKMESLTQILFSW
jgi:hypothetical protein